MQRLALNGGCVNFGLKYVSYLLAILILFAVLPTMVLAECVGLVGEKAVNACQHELVLNPHNLEARLALATALDKLGRKDEAIKVLNQGLNLFQDDAVSRSTLEEKRWIMQQKQGKRTASDATLRVKIIKCTKLKGEAALKACDDGLRSQPENPVLLAGRGDALLDLASPKVIDAINVYKKALTIVPSNHDIKRKLAHAENIRQKSVSNCMKETGKAALAACDRGMLKGSVDEAAIQARRGDLLVAMNRDKNALDAYRVAQQLEPGNAEVKQAISRLTTVKQKPSLTARPPQPPSSLPAKKLAVSNVPVVARTFSNAPLSPGITY